MKSQSHSSISSEQIGRKAYEIWERAGRPNGCATEHWYQAEAILLARQADGLAVTASAKPARDAAATRPSTGKRQKGLEMIS